MRVPSTMFMGIGLIVGLAVLLLTPLPSGAVTLDLTTGVPVPATGFGNSFIVSNGGISATVRAYSSKDISLAPPPPSFENFLAAELNVTSEGVGICNASAVVDCTRLRNAVNNVGGIREFVLLEFNTSVFLKEAIINPQTIVINDVVSGTDTDVSFFAGIGAPPNFPAISPSGLGTEFVDPELSNTIPLPLNPRSIDLASQIPTQVDWLLIGANLTDPDPEDAFRLASVKAVIPEPSTILLFGTGLAGLLLYNRRRKK